MPLILNGDGSVGALSSTEMGYLDGVTSAVQTQINGKLTTPGAWTEYTPTVTAQTGTITNYSAGARYTQIGKTVLYAFSVSIPNAGTGTNQLRISVPIPSVWQGATGIAREVAINGFLCAVVWNNANTLYLLKYDNGSIISSGVIVNGSIAYEVA